MVASGGLVYACLPPRPATTTSLLAALALAAIVLAVDRRTQLDTPTFWWLPALAGLIAVAMLLAKWSSSIVTLAVIALTLVAVLRVSTLSHCCARVSLVTASGNRPHCWRTTGVWWRSSDGAHRNSPGVLGGFHQSWLHPRKGEGHEEHIAEIVGTSADGRQAARVRPPDPSGRV